MLNVFSTKYLFSIEIVTTVNGIYRKLEPKIIIIQNIKYFLNLVLVQKLQNLS